MFGYGRIGRIHFKNIIENPNFNIIALCDKSDITVSDIYVTKNEDEIIKNKNIEAVIICGPTATHYKLILNWQKTINTFLLKNLYPWN